MPKGVQKSGTKSTIELSSSDKSDGKSDLHTVEEK